VSSTNNLGQDRRDGFAIAKELFVDENRHYKDVDRDYVLLNNANEAYKKLSYAVDKPLKIILLYGYPGSGKTAMLHRLYSNISKPNGTVLYYPTPTFMEDGELVRVFKANSTKEMPAKPTFFELIELFSANFEKDSFLVLLDEAQLYSERDMEYIRLLSDTKIFKFIVALHRLEEEHLVAKAHFQSRIWENIELPPLGAEELRFFIERKLLSKDINHIISMFSNESYKLIHKFTDGNIRESMKYMYKLFDFYEFLEKHRPSEVDYKKIRTKHLEMVAIEGGYINV
jgi:4-hydroxy-tetrahydrodipicolinate synthase